MKQILAFALAILLCFCAFSGCENQEKPGANSTDFTFKLNDNGILFLPEFLLSDRLGIRMCHTV